MEDLLDLLGDFIEFIFEALEARSIIGTIFKYIVDIFFTIVGITAYSDNHKILGCIFIVIGIIYFIFLTTSLIDKVRTKQN